MHEEIADFCLKRIEKLGADYCEVRCEETSSTGFLLKNGITEFAGFDLVSGLGVRFIVNGKLGFFSTNRMEKGPVDSLIRNTFRAVKKSKMAEKVTLAKGNANIARYKVDEKKPIADKSSKEKLKILIDLEKELLEIKAKSSRYLSLGDSVTAKYIVNSEGARILSRIPRISFHYYITVSHKGASSQRYWQYGKASGYEAIDSWNLGRVLKNEMYAMMKNISCGIKPPEGKMDLVVGPEVTGIMVHESAGHPYEADRILGREAAQAGESFIKKDMIGTRIGSGIVNVADDPTMENSYGFFLYDDEGVKARPKILIKNGMINEFLHNRSTANEMGIKSNGSARAVSSDRETIVRMSNTILLPGEHSEEELIEGIKNGIYMKNFTEWNIDDVRLNQKYVGLEAYLIKNGKITVPVRNPTIEITTPQLWMAVDAIAKNSAFHAGSCGKGEPMQAIPVFFGGPSFRLHNIRMK